MWCPQCSKDVAAVATMNGAAQVVQTCPTCQQLLSEGALTPPMAATGKAIGGDGDDVRVLPVIARGPAQVVPIRPGPMPNVPTPAGPPVPANPIDGIMQRLAWLEGEIAKAKGYEAEAKALRGMLGRTTPRKRKRARKAKAVTP